MLECSSWKTHLADREVRNVEKVTSRGAVASGASLIRGEAKCRGSLRVGVSAASLNLISGPSNSLDRSGVVRGSTGRPRRGRFDGAVAHLVAWAQVSSYRFEAVAPGLGLPKVVDFISTQTRVAQGAGGFK